MVWCRDITEQKLAEQALKALAQTDKLTGLSNRRQLDEGTAAAVARAARARSVLALYFLDLDGFKSINDRHGHAAGDIVLVEIARRLRMICRTSDLVARQGGDEFAVLSEALRGTEDVVELAERFVLALKNEICVSGVSVVVTPSIGVAVFDGQESVEAFFARADRAMYEAKSAGKCTYRFARPGLHAPCPPDPLPASSAAFQGQTVSNEVGPAG